MQKSADIASQMLATDEAATMIQKALKLTSLLPKPLNQTISKRLKLQLIGLPVRNLHGFNMIELTTSSNSKNSISRFSSSSGVGATGASNAAGLADEIITKSSRERSLTSTIRDFGKLNATPLFSTSTSGGISTPPVNAPNTPAAGSSVIEKNQPILQGILKKKAKWGARWKPVYCVIKNGIFR